MKRTARSLKRPIILQTLLVQFAVLFLSVPLLVGWAIRFDSGGPYVDERIAPVMAAAVVRDTEGGLEVRMTPALAELQRETPDLWFVAQDAAGHSVSFGQPPAQYASLVGNLNDLSYAILRDRNAPHRLAAVLRRETSSAGELWVLGHGRPTRLDLTVALASNLVVIPIFVLLVVMSLIVTPWIVQRSLTGVARVSREAEQIDIDRRGSRLSETAVPSEIAPLVRAVNQALGRLDEGYERQRRFIASAAHELRTPIAILRMKVETADSPTERRLGADVDRLANLAEQLLDLQRLETEQRHEPIDLAGLVRRVVGDLAPLVIASGRRIAVEIDKPLSIRGDTGAIERVLTNLVQNALEHGGHQVTLRVLGSIIEVEDDGPGIPAEDREAVFEPFHRLQPRSRGTGLGLHLVQQVVERHGGRISISGAPGGGTIARAAFPSV